MVQDCFLGIHQRHGRYTQSDIIYNSINVAAKSHYIR